MRVTVQKNFTTPIRNYILYIYLLQNGPWALIKTFTRWAVHQARQSNSRTVDGIYELQFTSEVFFLHLSFFLLHEIVRVKNKKNP